MYSFFFLRIRRPPGSTRTDTLFPYTTLFRSPTAEATDWSQIVQLYDQLFAVRPNPVVAMNRAIAMGELHGPEVGLEVLESIARATLADYQPYHAARADPLARPSSEEHRVGQGCVRTFRSRGSAFH